MRIEPPSAYCRMTGEAVTLDMAADARLEILARRLAVTEGEEPLCIVEARAEHAARD